MTRTADTLPPIVEQPDERGSALIGALLLLMMMSALAAAMVVSGHTETLISRNERSAAQAQAAAEAGLNHAVELAIRYISHWNANGHGSAAEAVSALLAPPGLGARPGITAAEDIPAGTRLAIAGGINAEYEASVVDDAGAPGENDGNPVNDANGTVIVRARGYAQDSTWVELEAMIGSSSIPGALVVCGDVSIGGSALVSGAEADVYATGTVTTSPGHVEGTITSGAVLTCPTVEASNYRHFADFILKSNGTMTDLAGTVLPCCNNWSYNSGTGTWSRSGNSTSGSGTYYVEGNVNISGSPGSAKSPFLVTLIAEGSIDISGHPHIMPDTPELLFVTDHDLKIAGAIDTGDPLTAGGQMMVHEQLLLTGNPSLVGQLVVENATSVDPLVTSNSISGNVDIIYNGGLGDGEAGGGFQVTGWQEVR